MDDTLARQGERLRKVLAFLFYGAVGLAVVFGLLDLISLPSAISSCHIH
ncbi:MAG: hypothetical protein KC910_03930 [Candidatus Eremiobacteraeota bacterium]|nr:hypothetical protein [Candidatus Eremiobacteraeota bacterium]